jgi:hypothetical protein
VKDLLLRNCKIRISNKINVELDLLAGFPVWNQDAGERPFRFPTWKQALIVTGIDNEARSCGIETMICAGMIRKY